MSSYVVTRPYATSNVGSNLASLAGAAWLAGRLERTLVVDWRGMTQLADPELNYFTEFFAAPATIRGVPALYAPAAEVGGEAAESGVEWLEPGQARALGERRAEPPSGPVVLQTYHGLDRIHPGPEDERVRLLRAFYRELRPVDEIGETIERWWTEHLDGRFVVGVNVRTGNGHYFAPGERYHGRVDTSIFEEQSRFVRILERACRARLRGLPTHVRRTAAIFYATDSAGMSERLAALPNAVTRRSVFPPPGTGDTHDFGDDAAARRTSVVDTVADMFLLARCDALVYNGSLFNQYARVVTGHFSGNQVHLESLFLRKRLAQAARSARRRMRTIAANHAPS